MTPLVTVMIPTRKRLHKLLPTLRQLGRTATGVDYAVIVMIDEDDTETMDARRFLEIFPNLSIITTPRLGYSELDCGYFARMERESNSPWVWIGGDDMLVDGDWLGEIRKVETHGFILQPEISKLGASTYPMAENQAFPIFPKFCWKEVSETFPRPMDTHGCDMLKRKGWKTRFLKGVTMWHDRPSEDEIREHRKM